jgi:type IV pilus assembly protein PilY1
MKTKLIFKKYCILLTIVICCLVYTPCLYADESALFTAVAPDALIVFDLSGSMLWAPAGEYMYTSGPPPTYEYWAVPDQAYYASSGTGHTQSCWIYAYGTVPKYSNGSCSGPFYINNSHTGYTTDCSRIAIAKRAIFDMLDDNNDNTVDDQDENNLNVRIGYMRFHDGNDTAGDYTKDNNKLIEPLGTAYSTVWSSVNSDYANSGTPLVFSLNEAKTYLDYHKTKDAAAACRQKFVILITDGEDTYSCGGDGSSSQADQYKRRRETVDKARALADAGYRVFVIGFGADMPDALKYTLNWAAYYGNTDNPVADNVGDETAYNASLYNNCNAANMSEEPGQLPLTGYAFIASSAGELTDALKQAINIIREATYSFSMSSIQTSRTTDENYLYEASFEPVSNDPFWLGHLKKYAINADGSVGSELWNAGEVLKLQDASSRTIYTHTSGALPPTYLSSFTTSSITPEDLGLGSTEEAQRDAIVGYIRGEAAYNPDNWKLGDIFRSAPVTIATPSFFYNDTRDSNGAFATFRTNNERTSANGKRTIVIGANDGQIHAFLTGTGEEKWSFIPPNMLPKLKNIAHSSHPTGLTHQYFADGPVMVGDVWLGTGDGTGKSPDDWKTLMIFGEGRGGLSRLWSSQLSCDSDFSENYSATYPYYGGYYCLDVTDPLNPIYKWRINPTASESPYLGDPWVKVFPGKVKINGEEKWVGFMGGGYNAQNCVNMSKCDERGKGFFVIDLNNGNTLWSVTLADNSGMIHSIPATASIVDTDNDGFIDTAYVGDLGGSMWRFKFCRASDGSTCTTSDWSAGVLFQQATSVIRPIYTAPAVSKDSQGNLWVYWGTGDKEEPTDANAQEKFYGVKDNDRSTTWAVGDLENITSSTYDPSSTSPGWYMNFAGQGEKVLGEPLVFGGVVYFSTFIPDQSGDPCSYGGDAQLYGVDYVTGAGKLSDGDRSMNIGTGIPTAPVISLKPGTALSPDIYVTVSGGGGSGSSSTQRISFDPPTLSNRTNMLFWFDRRLQ